MSDFYLGPLSFLGTLNVNAAKSEKPTAFIRWGDDGKLQQLWEILTIEGGVTTASNSEWREVPAEETK